MRKDLLVEGEIYHIFNKSIAGYTIFNEESNFFRMLNVICFYRKQKPKSSFSQFIKLSEVKTTNSGFLSSSLRVSNSNEKEKLVEIVAYCLMPTHFHLILRQLKENGIAVFISNVQNSYTRYFNLRHKRKGPLWEGRFQSVLVESDEQLLHLTRYIHLNPVTAYLVNKPEDWSVSSYQEYLLTTDKKICKYEDLLDIKPPSYKEFVEDRISYQKELAKIKDLIIE